MPRKNKEEFIIEFYKIGNSVKVSAVDPITLTEATVVVPSSGLSKIAMQKLAIRKLKYILGKNNSGASLPEEEGNEADSNETDLTI